MALFGGKDPYKGKHRSEEPTKTGTDFDNIYVPSHETCAHASRITLAGRIVCNSGCAADLGPANG